MLPSEDSVICYHVKFNTHLLPVHTKIYMNTSSSFENFNNCHNSSFPFSMKLTHVHIYAYNNNYNCRLVLPSEHNYEYTRPAIGPMSIHFTPLLLCTTKMSKIALKFNITDICTCLFNRVLYVSDIFNYYYTINSQLLHFFMSMIYFINIIISH